MKTKIEKPSDNLVCFKHNSPVSRIIMVNLIPFRDTLLCEKCQDEQLTECYKTMSLNEIKGFLDSEHHNYSNKQDEYIQQQLNKLQNCIELITDARSKVLLEIENINQIIQEWITELEHFIRYPEDQDPIIKLQQMYQNNFVHQIDQDYRLEELNKSYQDKAVQAFQSLLQFDQYKNCLYQLENVTLPKENQNQDHDQSYPKTENGQLILLPHKKEKVNEPQLQLRNNGLVHTILQRESSCAIGFNHQGSILVAGTGKEIKIWKFCKGNLIEQFKINECGYASYLIFSQNVNWFAIGSKDNTIQCWQEQPNNTWSSSECDQKQRNIVICLVMNKNEDSLFSCDYTQMIKIWKVNCQDNKILFDYDLKHPQINFISCLSLNESETMLVACSQERQTSLWMKGDDDKWFYQSHISKNDYGQRISFIGDNLIAWQQNRQGKTHIIAIENGILSEKQELSIFLNQEIGYDYLFPIIYNRTKQILIQKHGKYVYILKKQDNDKFIIESELLCGNQDSFGAITQDGEYLAIKNLSTEQFKIYNLGSEQQY